MKQLFKYCQTQTFDCELKAARIRSVIDDEPLMEFGTRRAQEMMQRSLGNSRAAVSWWSQWNWYVRAGKLLGIPKGTSRPCLGLSMAMITTLSLMPQLTVIVFFVDTYDTFRIGVPAAIQVARELGDKINFKGVRIDSGDIA